MCLHGALYYISFNLICTMTAFRKIMFDRFISTPGAECVCKDRICACMVLYPFPSNLICNMTNFRKKCFHLLT